MRHGSHIDPPNRFTKGHQVPDFEHWDGDLESIAIEPRAPIEYFDDATESIVSENNSPDIPFRYSVNPYRGCAHGCAYCYARNSHEYLGMSAGLDFETKIMVKREAPRLLREFLSRPAWAPEVITFSGVTDCYQPAEREFRLTRGCLEVAWEARQPISIVTKNALVVRDADILGSLARQGLAKVYLSINSLDVELATRMEPRTSVPAARLRAIAKLTEAGIPTGIMVAPVIPGLNDFHLPLVLKAAKEAGAVTAGYILLRLPLTVEPVFREWLRREQPLQAGMVEERIRATRGGQLSDSTWGARMKGTGEIADQIRRMFRIFASELGLDQPLPPLRTDLFDRPLPRSGQMRLFD